MATLSDILEQVPVIGDSLSAVSRGRFGEALEDLPFVGGVIGGIMDGDLNKAIYEVPLVGPAFSAANQARQDQLAYNKLKINARRSEQEMADAEARRQYNERVARTAANAYRRLAEQGGGEVDEGQRDLILRTFGGMIRGDEDKAAYEQAINATGGDFEAALNLFSAAQAQRQAAAPKVVTTNEGVFLAQPDGSLMRVGNRLTNYGFGDEPGGYVRVQNPATGEVTLQRPGAEGAAGAQAGISPVIAAAREERFAEEEGKQYAQRLTAAQQEAEQAAGILAEVSVAKPLIDEAITGAAAEKRRKIARAIQTLTGEELPELSSTEELMAITSRFVGQSIQLFGAGTGLSDADREFARAMSANDFAAGAAALKRIISIIEREAARKVENYNKLRESAPVAPSLPVQGVPQTGEQPTQERRVRVYNPQTGRLE